MNSIDSDTNARVFESQAAIAEYHLSSGLHPMEHRLVSEFFDPQLPILDIGCGAGRTAEALDKLGFKVVGVDLSGALVERARIKCPHIQFHQADVQNLPFKDGQFKQALFSFNGFDYLYPQQNFIQGLREIRRVLNTSGLLLYTGHNIIGRFGRHLRSWREFISVAIRVHPRYLLCQLKGSHPLSWYWRYPEPFGELITFSAPPWVHDRLHQNSGFETVSVRGLNNEKSLKWITFREHHVHYVIRKVS